MIRLNNRGQVHFLKFILTHQTQSNLLFTLIKNQHATEVVFFFLTGEYFSLNLRRHKIFSSDKAENIYRRVMKAAEL